MAAAADVFLRGASTASSPASPPSSPPSSEAATLYHRSFRYSSQHTPGPKLRVLAHAITSWLGLKPHVLDDSLKYACLSHVNLASLMSRASIAESAARAACAHHHVCIASGHVDWGYNKVRLLRVWSVFRTLIESRPVPSYLSYRSYRGYRYRRSAGQKQWRQHNELCFRAAVDWGGGSIRESRWLAH
jgi:hypothetical protein